MASTLPGVLSGAAFGAALTASGVYLPSVIISQLKFEDWHMLQSFLTATAGSARPKSSANRLVAASLSRLGYAKFSPRGYSTLAIFGRADANVIGGALLGTGMALSGACPGTVASQTAVGITSGYWTLGGGLLGGLAWTGFVRPWAERRRKAAAENLCSATDKAAGAASAAAATAPPQLTVYEALGVSYIAALVGFEVLMGLVVRAVGGSLDLGGYTAQATRLAGSPPVPPVVGGLLIAAAQLVSVLARRSLVGTSGVFDEIGDFVWWLWAGIAAGQESDASKRPQRPKPTTAVFVSGIMLGSWAAAAAFPSLKDAVVGGGSEIPPLQTFLGGVSMVVGARMAGGCTSGHGISGISLLSVSSIITIASAILIGSVVAKTIY